MISQTVFPFKLEFSDEALTAHAGLSLMAEYHKSLGLDSLVNRCLPKPGSSRGYKPSVYVNSMVLMLQAGGQHLSDVRELGYERELLKLVGRKIIPDEDSLGVWLRRMGDPQRDQEGLKGLDGVNQELVKRITNNDGLKKYTLDADATEIVGNKYEAQRTYKGNKGYMPMLGFLYEIGVCIYDEFREGNVAPRSGQKSFYEACKARMPKGKAIGYYRADSGSYNSNLINELEVDGVKWAITAVQDQWLKKQIRSLGERVWQEPVAGCGYEVTELIHSTNETKKPFRLIIKREERLQKEIDEDFHFYHVVATSFLPEEKSTQEVLEWHNQRGQAENFNKEVKLGFGMEHMPCSQSHANAVFLRLGIIAYNLVIGFKRLSCPESWQSYTIKTLRWKFIQIAGKIIHHAGQVVLKIKVPIELMEIFYQIREKIYAFRWA